MGRSRVRRSLTALLVATVVAVSVAAALSAVQARGGGDLPETFQVRAPHVGDRGVYNITLHGDWKYDGFEEGVPFEFLRFEWQDDTAVYGHDGLMHDANAVRLEGLQYAPMSFHLASGDLQRQDDHWLQDNKTIHLAAGATQILASGQNTNRTGQFSGWTSTLGVPVVREDTDLDVRTAQWSYPEASDLCFLRIPLHVMPVDTDHALEFPPCTLQGLGMEKAFILQAGAVETIGGLQTVRFDGPEQAAVWYHDQLSAPVRIRLPSPAQSLSDEGNRDGHAILDLVAFEPGREPTEAGPDAPRDPLPPLAFKAPRPWGMDDSGVDHPFPASEAFRVALTDPDLGLQDFLDSHPDAALAYQWARHVSWHDEDHFSWHMGLSDGQGAFGFLVERTVEHWDEAVLGEPSGLPGTRYVSDEVSASILAEVMAENAMWGGGNLPEVAPTAASALERWRALTGRASLPEVPLYELGLECTDGECEYTLNVGADSSYMSTGFHIPTGLVAPADGSGWDLSWLRMGEDGHLHWIHELDLEYSSDRSIGPTGAGIESSATSSNPSAEPVPVIARIVLPTSSEEATAVGIAALLSAVLYWAWPVLKTTPLFGLFSRLRTPELLEQPNRRAIHDAITASPGIHFKGLQRETGLANGTLRHHLRHLVDGGLVAQRSGGRYTCYFPAGRIDARAMKATSLLKSEGSRAVLKAVEGRPGITAREVAHGTGLSPGTVAYHVDRLAGCGAVVKDRDGRQVRLHVSAWAAPTLDAA